MIDNENKELKIGRIAVSKLVLDYGTPLYVYDAGLIEERYCLLQKQLPDEVAVFYSVKANPNLAVCSYLRCLGTGAEVSSGGELFLACKSGYEPHQIIYAGPGKTEEELCYAISVGILSLNIESRGEMEKVARISSQVKKETRVSIRINPCAGGEGAKIKMGGIPRQFGIDEEKVGEVIEAARKQAGIKLVGIHVYSGTQILDWHSLIANMDYILKLAARLSQEHGISWELINLGGGLGIPYFSRENALDVEKFGSGFRRLFREVKRNHLFEKARFILEPGRFLVGESGVYLTCVQDVKESRGKKYLITDGGVNQHTAAASLGRFIRENFPVAVVNRLGEKKVQKVDIVGPLCTPLDSLATAVVVPKVKEGDIVGIFHSGAYGFSGSMLYFLSHPLPAEVIVHNGSSYLVRERGGYQDFLLHQRIPSCFL